MFGALPVLDWARGSSEPVARSLPAGPGPGLVSISGVYSWKALTSRLIERLIVEMKVFEETGYEMMDEESYLAHQRYCRNCDPEVAKARWDADIVNKDIFQVTVNGTKLVAVKLNTKYTQQKSITKQRELENPVQLLKTDAEKENGLKRAMSTLNMPATSAVFDCLNGQIFLSGSPNALVEYEQSKKARSEAALQEEVLGKRKQDELVKLASTSLTAAQRNIRRNNLMLVRQAKLTKYEQVESDLKALTKSFASKFSTKSLEKVDDETRESFNILEITATIEETLATVTDAKDSIRDLQPEDDTFDNQMESANLQLNLIGDTVKSYQDQMGKMLKNLQDYREESRKRKRDESKQKLKDTQACAKDFQPALPPSAVTIVLKAFSNQQELALVPIETDFDSVDFGNLNLFASNSPIAVALGKALLAWGEANVTKFCSQGAGALTPTGSSTCQRFAAPTLGTATEKTIAAAAWFTEVNQVKITELGTPVMCSSYGLPWIYTVKVGAYVGNLSSLPMSIFGGWLTLRAGTVAVVLTSDQSLTEAASSLAYLHANSGRHVQAQFRKESVNATLMEIGQVLYVPPGVGFCLVTSPKKDEVTDAFMTFIWHPHFSVQAGQASSELLASAHFGIPQFKVAYSAAKQARNSNWQKLEGFDTWWHRFHSATIAQAATQDA